MEEPGAIVERVARRVCPDAVRITVVKSAPLVHTYVVLTVEYEPEKAATARIDERETADEAKVERFVREMLKVREYRNYNYA